MSEFQKLVRYSEESYESPLRTTSKSALTRSISKISSTPGSSAELIEKTISEFGEIINQRRTELSELKRANQLRLNDDQRAKVIKKTDQFLHSICQISPPIHQIQRYCLFLKLYQWRLIYLQFQHQQHQLDPIT